MLPASCGPWLLMFDGDVVRDALVGKMLIVLDVMMLKMRMSEISSGDGDDGHMGSYDASLSTMHLCCHDDDDDDESM